MTEPYDWDADGVFDEEPKFETQAKITASPHGPSWDLELTRQGHEPVSITGVSDEALLVLVGDLAADGLIGQRSEPDDG